YLSYNMGKRLYNFTNRIFLNKDLAMRKSLILIASTLVSLSASSCIFAENFDPASIKQIHTQVQTNMYQRCLTEIPHATQGMCDCLGNKLQSNIDDAALS